MTEKPISLLIYSDLTPEMTELKSSLQKDFGVQQATSSQGLWSLANEIKPEVVVYYVSKNKDLAYSSALEVTRKLNAGLFVLTPSYLLQDELHYLGTGADNYLLASTPYQALKLRILRLGRRIQSLRESASLPFKVHQLGEGKNESITYNDLKINVHQELVYKNGEHLNLPSIQAKLLIAFLSLPDELITRQWLIANVWQGEEISPRSIDAQISKLKKVVPSLEKDLVNIYGKGYIFKSTQRAAV